MKNPDSSSLDSDSRKDGEAKDFTNYDDMESYHNQSINIEDNIETETSKNSFIPHCLPTTQASTFN